MWLLLILPLTSACEEETLCDCEVPVTLQVSVWNSTDEAHTLSVRPLLENLQVDCSALMKSPQDILTVDLFADGAAAVASPGHEIPLQVLGTKCGVFLVESDTLPDIFVVFPNDLPYREENPGVVNEPAENTIIIRANAENTQFFWEASGPQFHYEVLPVQPVIPPTAACEMPSPREAIDWEINSFQKFAPIEVLEGEDGCHQVIFAADEPWTLCAPFDMVRPLVPPPPLEFVVPEYTCNQDNDGFSFCDGVHIQTCDGQTGVWEVFECSSNQCEPADTLPARCVRTPEISVELSNTTFERLVIDVGFEESYRLTLSRGFAEYESTLLNECSAQPDVCGLKAIPASIEVNGEFLSPGQRQQKVEGKSTQEVFIARASGFPILDRTCAQVGNRVSLESLYVEMAESLKINK